MVNEDTCNIAAEFIEFISRRDYPCIGAKAALAKAQVKCMVAGHMAYPVSDKQILEYLYNFTDSYRSTDGIFHSATIIFTGPANITEPDFENLLWQRLQAISDLDALTYGYDKRVSANPASPDFSFSVKEEAFFIIGMHASNSREARRFSYPALIFNPHAQFETMKKTNKYEMMKQTVRKRDISFSGSVNPMLDDYGISPETMQYSGKKHSLPFQCPLKINHEPG